MTGYLRPLHAYPAPAGERFALLRGPARELLTQSRIHGYWDRTQHGYLIAADRLPDLLAYASTQTGWVVRVHPEAATT